MCCPGSARLRRRRGSGVGSPASCPHTPHLGVRGASEASISCSGCGRIAQQPAQPTSEAATRPRRVGIAALHGNRPSPRPLRLANIVQQPSEPGKLLLARRDGTCVTRAGIVGTLLRPRPPALRGRRVVAGPVVRRVLERGGGCALLPRRGPWTSARRAQSDEAPERCCQAFGKPSGLAAAGGRRTSAGGRAPAYERVSACARRCCRCRRKARCCGRVTSLAAVGVAPHGSVWSPCLCRVWRLGGGDELAVCRTRLRVVRRVPGGCSSS